eukprot:gnl/Trimastix_PCT/3754.p1 GENE.gnl/Trimastix_PCT/3754~~gnl/Trimastix_PCT/3754.p1  ORF type:complete len:289 (+),score=41.00 gnl/Trimastix_PCT/3754:125-991(+)
MEKTRVSACSLGLAKNIERVRKDEEEYRQQQELIAQKQREVDQERRIEMMRKRSGGSAPPSSRPKPIRITSDPKGTQKTDKGEKKEKVPEPQQTFHDLVKDVPWYASVPEPAAPIPTSYAHSPNQPSIKPLSSATPLAPSPEKHRKHARDHSSSHREDRHRHKHKRHRHSHSHKRHRRHHHRRKHESDSETSSSSASESDSEPASSSSDSDEARAEIDLLAQLRAERLAREEAEQGKAQSAVWRAKYGRGMEESKEARRDADRRRESGRSRHTRHSRRDQPSRHDRRR